MMGKRINRILTRAAERHWESRATSAEDLPVSTLRTLRKDARELKTHLDRVLHEADARLALPIEGASFFPRPQGCDWSWRPDVWRGRLPVTGISPATSQSRMGQDAQLFHDSLFSEITLHQLRNQRREDLAPYGLQLDVFEFDGSFLSLVINLPPAATADLSLQHLIRMDCILECERPTEIFARLNIKHGPNTEKLVRELPAHDKALTVEFDLAYSKMSTHRLEGAWIDLIFEAPRMNQIILRDLTFARVPRANI